MTKKQSFINKKEARSFTLVHKSKDEESHGDNSNGRVFVEVTRGMGSVVPCPLFEQDTAPQGREETVESENENEADEGEEYDYLQHMKPMGQTPGAVYIANQHFRPHLKDDEYTHPDVQEIMAALEDEAYVEENLADTFFVTITGSEKRQALETIAPSASMDPERDESVMMPTPPKIRTAGSMLPTVPAPERTRRLIDAQFESMLLQYDDGFEDDNETSDNDHDDNDNDNDNDDDDNDNDNDNDESDFSDSVMGETMQDYLVHDEAYDFKKKCRQERVMHSIQEMDALRQALASVTTLSKTLEDASSDDSFNSGSEQWLRPVPAKRWDIQVAAKEITESGPTYVPILVRESKDLSKKRVMLDPKTGFPKSQVTEPSHDRKAMDSTLQDKAPRPNLGAARQKCETNEEKRLRKEAVKQEKQNRRQQKKSIVF